MQETKNPVAPRPQAAIYVATGIGVSETQNPLIYERPSRSRLCF